MPVTVSTRDFYTNTFAVPTYRNVWQAATRPGRSVLPDQAALKPSAKSIISSNVSITRFAYLRVFLLSAYFQ